MIGYVYLTVNDINTTIYVGKRQKARFEKSYKGSGTHLKLAFKKYGKEHFHTSVLEWCETDMRPNQRTAYAHISECCNGRRKTAYGYKWAIEAGWKV